MQVKNVKNKFVFKLIALASISLCAGHAQADDNWSFKNVSLNQFTWTPGTKSDTEAGFAKKSNFTFLEVEGGMGGNWGDLYGFIDLENPTHKAPEADASTDRRLSMKAVGNFNLTKVGDVPINLHAQIYSFDDAGFSDQNRVLGLSTAYFNNGFWAKPFIGVHQELQTGVPTGMNGYMAGWAAGYDFKMFGESMSLTHWHETEFARRTPFLGMADKNGNFVTGGRVGHNGGLTLGWNVNKDLGLAMTYRYAKDKLGSATLQNGVNLSLKYKF